MVKNKNMNRQIDPKKTIAIKTVRLQTSGSILQDKVENTQANDTSTGKG